MKSFIKVDLYHDLPNINLPPLEGKATVNKQGTEWPVILTKPKEKLITTGDNIVKEEDKEEKGRGGGWGGEEGWRQETEEKKENFVIEKEMPADLSLLFVSF